MLIFILLIVLLIPSISHATVFWTDEMESTVSGQFYFADWFAGGSPIYTHDSTTKFSGSKSLRANFYQNCDISGPSLAGQCGGALSRSVPPTLDLYDRVYIRKSGSSANGASIQTTYTLNGVPNRFKSGFTATKLTRYVSNNDPEDGESKGWINLGNSYGHNILISMENVPTEFATTDINSNVTLADNVWYCIARRVKMNTIVNGVANADGIAQVWIDGTLRINRTNVVFRRADGDGKMWDEVAVVRQNGWGNVWWDKWTAANEPIGCTGDPTPGDSTPPSPPTSLTAQ